MWEAETKHQLLTPVTCSDRAWSPTCWGWIRPSDLCCTGCFVHPHGWDRCTPDTLREQQFLQGHGVSRNPINIQSQISPRQNFCGGKWVQGNVHICIYLRRSHMGTARKSHFYILNTGYFFKKTYVIYLPESRNPNTCSLNSRMSKGVRAIKKLQKKKSLNPSWGRCWHSLQVGEFCLYCHSLQKEMRVLLVITAGAVYSAEETPSPW